MDRLTCLLQECTLQEVIIIPCISSTILSTHNENLVGVIESKKARSKTLSINAALCIAFRKNHFPMTPDKSSDRKIIRVTKKEKKKD